MAKNFSQASAGPRLAAVWLADTVLLAAAYLQQKHFRHEGMHLEFKTKNHEGVEDTELNKLLTRNLDSVDRADCEQTLMMGGIAWDQWR